MKILVALVLVTLSINSFAGIKDKKAMRASEGAVTAAIAGVMNACGNAALEAKIDWSAWDSYDYDKLGGDKVKILGYIASLATSVTDEMATLCKDADYKAEIAKLTTLNFSGNKDQSYHYVDIAVEKEKTLNVKLNADGVSSWKTADILKAAWD